MGEMNSSDAVQGNSGRNQPAAASPTGRTVRRFFASLAGFIGEILITAALIVGFYIVWQVWWTGVLSQKEQAQDDQTQTSSWTSAKSSSGYTIAPAYQPGTAPVEKGAYVTGKVIAKIYIPRFGAKWSRNIVEGTSLQQLNMHGLGHYSQTQRAGAVGNFAVAGHRAGYGEPLAHVDQFTSGDKIVVRTQNYWYVYQYTGHEIVEPADIRVVYPVPNHPEQTAKDRLITLTTCEPRYAYITAAHRWITYGKLVSWSKVSEGIPQALAGKTANGQVTFTQETSADSATTLPDMSRLMILALCAYAIIYLAAALVWRYRGIASYRALDRRQRPMFSLYGWLIRLQPGPAPIRVILVLFLIFAGLAACFQWGYPWMAKNIPFLQISSNFVG
ncbi:sortase family protein [Scardovia inopinata]|uniref:Sortase n=1 Tax=Scardovia inopinata F0304 TaxID=641146 RepID=W5IHW5_SCAIO|nr:class E sortase [Scardovia inopinata]EFG26424.1 sortase [Scardovia inopinata F0304]BAR07465.1 putative sortase [Scardovia inopinata JCM 12537]SUV51538.1 sortase family protein [Scardovia inopinata]